MMILVPRMASTRTGCVVKGYYCLALECDVPSCNQAEDFTAMNDEFVTPTRMESLEVARGRGWMIAHNVKGKPRKCWCPFHADERRNAHYRVKQ